jgi:hypothetical protein
MSKAVGSALWGKKNGGARKRVLAAAVAAAAVLAAPASAAAGIPGPLFARGGSGSRDVGLRPWAKGDAWTVFAMTPSASWSSGVRTSAAWSSVMSIRAAQSSAPSDPVISRSRIAPFAGAASNDHGDG